MINLAAMHRVRKHPVFAGYFEAVLPIFRPVVFWHLLRIAGRMDARRCGEFLVSVHWWGGIEITYYGDPAPSPSAYRPVSPMRKAWSDIAWSSSLPANLLAEAYPLISPCDSVGFGGKGFALQRLREGAKKACARAATADSS